MTTAALGDLEVVDPGVHHDVVVATSGAGSAEVVAQIRQLEGRFEQLRVYLGPRDLIDGFDESYVHARLVELCDLLRSLQPQSHVIVVGIPPVEGREPLRLQCNAAAEVTADLRGFRYRAPATL